MRALNLDERLIVCLSVRTTLATEPDRIEPHVAIDKERDSAG